MIDLINQLVEKTFPGVLIEARSGMIYLLLNHYHYLDYRKDAKRAKLGTLKVKDGYAYISSSIKSLNEIVWMK